MHLNPDFCPIEGWFGLLGLAALVGYWLAMEMKMPDAYPPEITQVMTQLRDAHDEAAEETATAERLEAEAKAARVRATEAQRRNREAIADAQATIARTYHVGPGG